MPNFLNSPAAVAALMPCSALITFLGGRFTSGVVIFLGIVTPIALDKWGCKLHDKVVNRVPIIQSRRIACRSAVRAVLFFFKEQTT